MFDNELKDVAWNNANSLKMDNPKELKVCFICYFEFKKGMINKQEVRMKYEDYNNEFELNGWVIDHIDGNKANNNHDNLVAVHYSCYHFQKHQNFTKLFLEYKKENFE